MATRTTVTLICDRPHEKETVAGGLVRFSFGGTAWEMHLCAACRGEMAVAVSPFASSARHAEPPAPQRRGHAKVAIEQRRQRREWMRANGWPGLGVTGREPVAAIAAWDARQESAAG